MGFRRSAFPWRYLVKIDALKGLSRWGLIFIEKAGSGRQPFGIPEECMGYAGIRKRGGEIWALTSF